MGCVHWGGVEVCGEVCAVCAATAVPSLAPVGAGRAMADAVVVAEVEATGREALVPCLPCSLCAKTDRPGRVQAQVKLSQRDNCKSSGGWWYPGLESHRHRIAIARHSF